MPDLAPLFGEHSQEVVALRARHRVVLVARPELFRRELTALGFRLAGEGHPIIPVMLGDATIAQTMAQRLLAEGIYVVGFSYPVVPKGQARIRTQVSAAHKPRHIKRAVAAFAKVGRELGVIP